VFWSETSFGSLTCEPLRGTKRANGLLKAFALFVASLWLIALHERPLPRRFRAKAQRRKGAKRYRVSRTFFAPLRLCARKIFFVIDVFGYSRAKLLAL
jgi:hypothetical protein